MQMQPVKSSNLAEVGYDADRSVLGVRFLNNPRLYEYAGVPAEEYGAMLAAESVGSHFARNIKGKFDLVKGAGE